MDPINSMWIEKYRPKRLNQMVGNFKDKIAKYLENPASMQHLLLYSITPGSGKTSLAKVIVNELDADVLIMNSSDDRKIESVRDKVNNFVKTKSSKNGVRRIVIMDEVDGMTNIAQDALRNIMESYASNALFILTCNHVSKINDAIKSRCAMIEFSTPDKTEIKQYLTKICVNEKLQYTDDGLDRVININYPSIRNCVQTLQSLHTEGKTVNVDDAKHIDDTYQMLWDKILVDKDWKHVKDYVFMHNVDIRELNKYFWLQAVESSHIKMIQITASNEDKFVRGGEHIIIFVTSLIEMAK